MIQVIRYFSVAFYVSYILIGFVWPSLSSYWSTGINPLTFGNSDSIHDYVGRSFKLLLVAIGFAIGLYCIGSAVYEYMSPFRYLEHNYLQVAGVVLCILSLGWTAVAQWQMGNSWRIGIDEAHKAELITSGLFTVSRNPVFLGMIMTMVGLFMMMPNAITLSILMSGYLLIQIQVRLEESFLSQQYGDEYKIYKIRVGRFLFFGKDQDTK